MRCTYVHPPETIQCVSEARPGPVPGEERCETHRDVPQPYAPTEVARMRGNLPAKGLSQLVTYLERAYGKGLTMRQDGGWFVFSQPGP